LNICLETSSIFHFYEKWAKPIHTNSCNMLKNKTHRIPSKLRYPSSTPMENKIHNVSSILDAKCMKAKFSLDHSWHCCVFSKNLRLGFTTWLKSIWCLWWLKHGFNHIAKRTLKSNWDGKAVYGKKKKGLVVCHWKCSSFKRKKNIG